MAIADIKPGAVYRDHPTVIYVKVLCWVPFYPPKFAIGKICTVPTKFHQAINKAAAQYGHNIMNITDCSKIDDFDAWGDLTHFGN